MTNEEKKARLQDLEAVIHAQLEIADRGRKMELTAAKACGDAQIEIKALLEHGQFEAWRRAKYPQAKSTLSNHKRIAENWAIVEEALTTRPALGVSDALKAIAASTRKAVSDRKQSSAWEYLVRRSRRLWRKADLTEEERARSQRAINTHYRIFKGREDRLRRRTGCVASHFLDSGSFSLHGVDANRWAKANQATALDYYSSEEFYSYRDAYARFVHRYSPAIDYYANVDVIGNPELTWLNQQYLEQVHRCKPVPVVHYAPDDDLRWLKHYIDRGYDYIALGGLVGVKDRTKRHEWIARCFEMADGSVKFHGFGIGTQPGISKHRWHSVDSTAWSQTGGDGRVYVPPFEDGEFRLDKQCKKIHHSELATLPAEDRRNLKHWLAMIGVRYGKGEEGKATKKGVSNNDVPRRVANMLYIQRVADHYNVRCYFTGNASLTKNPEVVLGDDANIMLSYFDVRNKTEKGRVSARFRRVLSARLRASKLLDA